MDIQLHVLEKVQVGAFIHAVAFTLFFYDYLLTISDEIKLVWHKPQKPLGRLLFLMNRYLAFIDVPLSFYNQVGAGLSDARCQRIDSVTGGMFFVGILVSEFIMILRVWILWGQTRIITIILILMVMITAIFCAVEMAQSDYQLISLAFIGRRGCYPTRGSPLSPSIPILGLADETGLFILTMIASHRGRHSHFHINHKMIPEIGFDKFSRYRSQSYFISFFYPSNIADMFARDGAIYYITIVAAAMASIYFSVNKMWAGILPTMLLQRTLNSILVSRIFIYLRQRRMSCDNIDPQFR